MLEQRALDARASLAARQRARPRRLRLKHLEERVMMSASPVAPVEPESQSPPEAGDLGAAATSPVASGEFITTWTESSDEADARRELVFVDTAAEDYEQLVADLLADADSQRHFDIHLLDRDRDGVQQISEVLGEYSDLDAIHIVSHGSEGTVNLGSTWLSADNLNGYAGSIAAWGNSLSTDADVLFYGCELAGNAEGETLVETLAALTGADVAASSDDTGNAALGGDWDLEYSVGQIQTDVAFGVDTQLDWVHLLAPSSLGMAIWAESGSNTAEYREWDGTTYSGEANAVNLGTWRVMQGAEAPTRDEKIVVGVDTGGTIEGQIWDGSTWSALPINPMGAVTQTYWWGMDVAYESSSGDAVLVWTDGANLEYATWDGATWSSVSTIGAYSGATPRQLQLAASPDSDEMVVIVSDANKDDWALVWDGSSWGNEQFLNAAVGATDRVDVYVAYEQQSGDAMVIYGRDTTSAYYRTWNGSSWSAESSVAAPVGVTGQVRWTTLASDPTSDRIALAVLSNSSEVWLNVWNGTSWDSSSLGTTSANGTNNPNVAVAFESTSGEAIATYGEGPVVRYRTWTSGGGWSNEQNLTGATNSNSMFLWSDLAGNEVMLGVQDVGSDVNYVLWDGAAWGTPAEHETNSGETKNQPFLFLWDMPNQVPTTIGIGNVTVDEDAADTVIDLFAAFADAEDADSQLTYTVETNTNPAMFTGTTIDGVGGTLTLDYAADANGTANITARATDTGGLWVETVFTVTVDPVNDEPSFTTLGNQGSDGDTAPQTVFGFATALPGGGADENGQTFSYTVNNDHPGLFAMAPAIDAAGTLTYTLANNPFVSATVTVSVTDSGGTANGGDDTSPDQTFDIVLTIPTIDLDGDNSAGVADPDFAIYYTIGDTTRMVADMDASLSDANSPFLASLTVTITNLLDGTGETLTADTLGTGITANYDSGTGVLSLTGVDTVSNYRKVLRTVGYINTSADPDFTARTITFIANDGVNIGNVATTTVILRTSGAGLWMSTDGDVGAPSGVPGLPAWGDAEALKFSGPGFSLEPGGTSGSFSSIFDIDTFASGDTEIRGLHFVGTDIRVGSTLR